MIGFKEKADVHLEQLEAEVVDSTFEQLISLYETFHVLNCNFFLIRDVDGYDATKSAKNIIKRELKKRMK